MHIARRWRTWTAITAAVVAVAVVPGTPWAREWLRVRLCSYVRDHYSLALQVARVDVRVTALALTLHEVSLARADPSAAPLARADRIEIDVGARTLFGRWYYDRIVIARPVISLDLASMGTRRAGAGPSLPGIDIGQLDIQDLDFDVVGWRRVSFGVRDLSARATTDADSLAAEIEVAGRLSVNADASGIVLSGANAHVTLARQALTGTVHAWSDSADVRVEGAIPTAASGALDLRYSASFAAPGPIPAIAGAPLEGHFDVRGTVTGTRARPVAMFRVNGRNLERLPWRDGTLTAAGRASTDGITIDSCVVSTGAATLQLGGHVSFDAAGASHVETEWRVEDAGALPLPDWIRDAAASLQASGSMNWRWPGSAPSLASVSVTGQGEVRGGGDEQSSAATLAVDGRNGELTLRLSSSGLAGETAVDGRFRTRFAGTSLPDSAIEGAVQITSRDVSAAMGSLLVTRLAAGREVVARARGPLAMSLSIGGTFAAPRIDADVSGTAEVPRLGAVTAQASLRLDRHVLSADPVTLLSRAGRLEVRGGIDLSSDVTVGSADASFDLASLGAAVPSASGLTGTVAVSGNWDGPWPRPAATGRVTGSDIVAGGVRFDTLAGAIALNGDDLTISGVQLSQGGGSVVAEGQVNLARRDFAIDLQARDVRVATRVDASARSGDADGLLPDVTGVSMRARATGILPAANQSLPTATVDIAGLSGRVDGREIALKETQVVVSDTGLMLPSPARLTYGDASLTVSGAVSRTSDARLSVDVEVPRVDDLWALVRRAYPQWALSGEGSAQVRATVEGPLSAPRVSGTATLALASLRRGALEIARAFNARVGVSDDVVEILDASGRVLGGDLSLRSRFPLGWIGRQRPASSGISDEAGSASGSWSGDVGEVLAMFGVATPVSGRATLSLDARGSAPRLDAIEGTVTGAVDQVSVRKTLVMERAPIRMRLHDGRLTIDELALQGRDARVDVSGHVALGAEVRTQLTIRGESQLRVLDSLLPVRANGRVSGELQLIGPLGATTTTGQVSIDDVSFIAPRSRVSLAGWSGTIELAADRLVARRLRGQVNGGDADIDGVLAWGPGGALSTQLTITARDVFVEIADDWRSQLDADVHVTSDRGAPRASGKISVTTDAYRESMAELADMVETLTAGSSQPTTTLPAPLAATALDIQLEATGPLVIENRIAQIEMVPRLALTGTVARPALSGRVDVVPDGRIQAAGRNYRLNDGAIEFAPGSLVPRLNVSGETKIGSYDVTLRLTGPADAIETSLTSDPPLSELDLRSLLLTGQTTSVSGNTRGDSDFVADAVSSDVLGVAGQFVGLDSIQIGSQDFELVSDDVEAARRLTVSKRIGPRFELLFSENLDDNELTWIIVHRPRPGYEFRVSSRDNVEQSLEFRREVMFGPGASGTRAAPRTRVNRETIGEIVLTGQPGFDPREVQSVFKLKPGKRFDFTEWWQDRDRLERFYADRDYCAVRVIPTRTVSDEAAGRVRLEYRIARGPRTELEITGYDATSDLVARLKDAWSGVVLTDFLPDALTTAARHYLVEQGHLRGDASVEVSRPAESTVRAVVRITAGPQYPERRVEFDGHAAMTTAELVALAAPFTDVDAWIDPGPLLLAVEAEYQDRGYADVSATARDSDFTGRAATLHVGIVEGPVTTLRAVTVHGMKAAPDDQVRKAMGLVAGIPVPPSAVRDARLRVERHYRDQGYRDARVSSSAKRESATGLLDLTMTVAEGPLYAVRRVHIEGAESTRESLVRSAVTLAPGAAASATAASVSERKLYGMGVFRSASVQFEPAASPPASDGVVDVDARVTLEESRKYQLRFGVETSSEYEPAFKERLNSAGVAVDLRDRNFLGRAMSLGVGARYEPSLQSIRSIFSTPRFGAWPLRTNVYGLWHREDDALSADLKLRDHTAEFTVEQRWQPRRAFELAWGYNAAWRELRLLSATEPTRQRFDGVLASTFETVTIDRRDSPLDARRGWFQSASFQWGLEELGSTADYLRLHVRSSYYRSFGPVVVASAARFGSVLSWSGRPGPDVEDLFFKAGGTQSVRGYEHESLSAIEVRGIPLGGTRVLVLNQEIRFPVASRFSGVVFVDAGNTFYGRGIDFNDLALGVGGGIRIRTPLAPIRVDLAWPVPQRDKGGPRWHFSVGQMF